MSYGSLCSPNNTLNLLIKLPHLRVTRSLIHAKEIVTKEDLDEKQKEVFFYSISKAYFDMENNDLAFKYLNSANKLKLGKIDYSFNKDKKEFKKIKEFFLLVKTKNLKFFLFSKYLNEDINEQK